MVSFSEALDKINGPSPQFSKGGSMGGENVSLSMSWKLSPLIEVVPTEELPEKLSGVSIRSPPLSSSAKITWGVSIFCLVTYTILVPVLIRTSCMAKSWGCSELNPVFCILKKPKTEKRKKLEMKLIACQIRYCNPFGDTIDLCHRWSCWALSFTFLSLCC